MCAGGWGWQPLELLFIRTFALSKSNNNKVSRGREKAKVLTFKDSNLQQTVAKVQWFLIERFNFVSNFYSQLY